MRGLQVSNFLILDIVLRSKRFLSSPICFDDGFTVWYQYKLFMRLRTFIFVEQEGERFMWRDFLIAWYPDVRLTPLSDPLPLITRPICRIGRSSFAHNPSDSFYCQSPPYQPPYKYLQSFNPIGCGGGALGAPPIIKMWFPEKCSKEEVLIFFDFS